MSTTEETWRAHRASVEAVRDRLLARPECRDPKVRARALYAVEAHQVGAFHVFIAPRTDYPVLYAQTVWSPFETSWGGPAPDFVYKWLFLDGRRTYRIRGSRGTSLICDFQLFDSYMSKETMRSLGSYDLDAFERAPDGSFEIIASAEEHPGNWMRLDPSEPYIIVQVRDIFWDWGREEGVRMHVETLDRATDTMTHSEEELNRRIERAAGQVRGMINAAVTFRDRILPGAGGVNRFHTIIGAQRTDRGASARAGYSSMVYEIEPDEALILDFEPPAAKYWSVALMDPFWQTLDFSFHQSSLNGLQTERDADGRVRMVLSVEDPGIANWLDASESRFGYCMLRHYDGSLSAAPMVTRVKISDVRAHLPAGARLLSAAERAAQLERRARDSLRRWGL